MPRGRPIEPVVLTDDEKNQLLSLANSRSLPHGVVRRAQIVLACAQGEANASIARRMRLSDATVGKWRKRYRMQGIEGLHDELRAGRGLYVLPVKSRFGSRAPSLRKTVEAVAAQRGERIAASGAMAANKLGLTTQVPLKPVFLTSGPSRKLKLGHQEVELRHAPPWQLVLTGRKAGDAVRALAWLGPERAETALSEIGPSLTAEERQELASITAQMPGWLAGPVSRLAHG